MRKVVLWVGAALVAVMTPAAVATPAVDDGRATGLGAVPAAAGPDLLRMPPAVAPQLTNVDIWKADPILVSGATAYRDGEFLYQDWIYDDHGAKGGVPGSDEAWEGKSTHGSYRYPLDDAYADNAADLVELRVKPLAHATAFRVTLNTMLDPDLVGVTIALGESPTPRELPFGAAVKAPAMHFVTVHGQDATLNDAATNAVIDPAPTVAVDTGRNQLTVVVDHEAWDPARSTVRIAAGVGLWDDASDRYLVPAVRADEERPGGAGTLTNPPAFFNVAFREEPPITLEGGDTQNWWRESQQSNSLAANDISRFAARVDFAKLDAKIDDDSDIPTTGELSRIFTTRFPVGDGGVDPASPTLQLRGNLQPYSLYVPPQTGDVPYGLSLLMHGSGDNYNAFTGSRHLQQLASRGTGSIVLSPHGRGRASWFRNEGRADVFEAWADVAAHYPLDPDWTVASGYSMGGIASFDLAAAWPDLFARIHSIVGSGEPPRLGSLRNVDVLMWNALADELVLYTEYAPTAQALLDLGYRYELDMFTGEHLTLLFNDQYQPAVDWLGSARVEHDVSHVTYVVDPADVQPEFHLVADHAYWVSGVEARSDALATVDAVSRAFGRLDPVASGLQRGAGVLTGGALAPALPYVREYQTWAHSEDAPPSDALALDLENVGALTIDVTRARVSCDVDLLVTTDGPVDVTLAGCGPARHFDS